MRDVRSLIWLALIGLFRSRASLQAEILTLRHQLNVLRRKSPQRLAFTSIDRLVFAGLYRLAPDVLDALKIVRPETVIRWHRAGFRAYWRWKSRPRSGRPKTPTGNPSAHSRDLQLLGGLWILQTSPALVFAPKACCSVGPRESSGDRGRRGATD